MTEPKAPDTESPDDGHEVPVRRRRRDEPSGGASTRKGLLVVIPLVMAGAAIVALVFSGMEGKGIYSKPVDELVKNKETLERFSAEAKFVSKASAAGLRRGVFYYPGGSGVARDCLMIGPAFTVNGEDIDIMVSVLPDAIDEAVAGLAG